MTTYFWRVISQKHYEMMPKIVHVLIIRHKVHSGTYTISCYIVKYMLIVYFDIVYYR